MKPRVYTDAEADGAYTQLLLYDKTRKRAYTLNFSGNVPKAHYHKAVWGFAALDFQTS